MDAAVTELAERILDSLPFDPNDQQTMLIAALARFVAAPAPARERVFVLNGYAGTGKTSLVSALVRALDSMSKPVVLL
ncbi:MAG: ATP-dependent endonuclease, partial [Muribaculaceae bacterium]